MVKLGQRAWDHYVHDSERVEFLSSSPGLDLHLSAVKMFTGPRKGDLLSLKVSGPRKDGMRLAILDPARPAVPKGGRQHFRI